MSVFAGSEPQAGTSADFWESGPRRALDYGFTVAVVADGPVNHIADLVSPFDLIPGANELPLTEYRVERVGADGFRLMVDREALVGDSNAWHVMAMLQWHLNQSVVASSAGGRVLLHAAAAVKYEITVVLAAPMENGKTTTVTGLVRAGFGYLTDETVAIDPESFAVTAYPKALTIDQGSWPLFPDLRVPPIGPADASWYVTAERVRPGAQLAEAGPPGVLVFPAYRNGARTELTPMTDSEATLELARSTFRFEDAAERNLRTLARMCRAADAYRLDIGDLDEAVSLVANLVDEVRAP